MLLHSESSFMRTDNFKIHLLGRFVEYFKINPLMSREILVSILCILTYNFILIRSYHLNYSITLNSSLLFYWMSIGIKREYGFNARCQMNPVELILTSVYCSHISAEWLNMYYLKNSEILKYALITSESSSGL